MTRRLQPTISRSSRCRAAPLRTRSSAHTEAAVGELTCFTSSDARSTHRNQKFRVSRYDTSLETSIDSQIHDISTLRTTQTDTRRGHHTGHTGRHAPRDPLLAATARSRRQRLHPHPTRVGPAYGPGPPAPGQRGRPQRRLHRGCPRGSSARRPPRLHRESSTLPVESFSFTQTCRGGRAAGLRDLLGAPRRSRGA